ncbi:ATP-dependent helicase, partial [Kocuria sp.]
VGGPPPGLVNHKARLLTEAAQAMRLTTDRATVRDVAGEVEWAKVSMLTPDTYAAAAEKRSMPMGYDVRTMQRLYQSYEDLKADRHLIDFEDVLLITVGILEEDERIAAAVHSQYRQFVVDEYQDVSPLQQRLLDAWLGQRDDLCVVGDASQTIYSFTGATSRHLLEFPSRHPNARVVELIRDYRSTPQVVNTANQLLAARRPAAGSTPGTWATPLQLISQRPAGPEPSWNEYPDDEAEAAGVATRIQDLIDDGVPAREIAVLFRTNGQSQAFEAALADVNIGFQLRGTERFFNRPEIRQSLVQIRSAAKTLGDAPVQVPQQVRDMLSSLGYSARAPRSDSATRARWESLSALVSLADSMAHRASDEDEEFTLQQFSDELERRAKAQEAPVMDGVTLASMHSAKGLEWDAVFLAGLSEGLMPISFAETADGVDEERRLFYVGITRAREHLVLSWSLSRTPGGRPTRSRSRFLDAILPAGSSNAAQRRARRVG